MDQRIVEGYEVVAVPIEDLGYAVTACKHCLFSTRGSLPCAPIKHSTEDKIPCLGVFFVKPIDALTGRLTGIYPVYKASEKYHG